MKIYSENELDELACILKNDGVISVPTDTVYGICGCANSIKSYDKIMKIKDRQENKLLPIMCADEKQIKSVAFVNENALKLIHEFMPGPITLILNKKEDKKININNGGERETSNVAIRMATSKVLEKLIKKVGIPIFMTSANKSGFPVCKDLKEIEKSCPDLDGILKGNVSFGKESTIVDCTLDKIKILREGVISKEEINRILEDNIN